jgi:hypothetical protein
MGVVALALKTGAWTDGHGVGVQRMVARSCGWAERRDWLPLLRMLAVGARVGALVARVAPRHGGLRLHPNYWRPHRSTL